MRTSELRDDKGARVALFCLATLGALGSDLAILGLLGNLDTGLHPATFVALVPALLVSSLIVRPIWGALAAGAAAGGMIGLSGDSVIITSHGVPWSPALVFGLGGLTAVVVLLSRQVIRLWPHARREARKKAESALPHGTWPDASPVGPETPATVAEM